MGRLLDAINKAETELRTREGAGEHICHLPVPSGRAQAHIAPARINHLRTQVLRQHRENGVRSIMLTGAYPGDGASTTAVSLATTLSVDCGLRVLLADADVKQPGLHDVFKVGRNDGLTDVIRGKNGTTVGCKLVGPGNLFLLPAGKANGAGEGYFDSPRFDGLLRASESKFDFVVIDSAPVLSNPDALAVCSKVDGVIIVIAYGGIRRPAAERLKTVLLTAGANLIGVVVNRRKHYIPDWVYRRL
jgi:capsular exopolysaccharide synthesis family protein